MFEQLAAGETEIVVSMGREGKRQVKFYPDRNPYSAAMAAKLRSDAGKRAYRKRKCIAEPPNGWIKSVLGFRGSSVYGVASA